MQLKPGVSKGLPVRLVLTVDSKYSVGRTDHQVLH
eukprot:COSAG02_NODE_37891_length_436_cov_0.768546_2_plen_34_part_01